MAGIGSGSHTSGICIGGSIVGGSNNSPSWGGQMDALVSDLSIALDESQQLQRKKRPFRRRVNQQQGVHGLSDYSSSSAEEALQTGGANSQDNKSSMPLTDSDDEELSPCPRIPRYRASRPLRPPLAGAGMVESDSVNESFSPVSRAANIRRKPKCKRLALECGASDGCGPMRGQHQHQRWWRPAPVVHRLHTLHATRAHRSAACGGKRKRSIRDGGSEGAAGDEDDEYDAAPLHVSAPYTRPAPRHPGGRGECSVSSDESDGGVGGVGGGELFTCDEGREADDEQSDWFTEGGSGPVYGVPPAAGTMFCTDGAFNSGVTVSMCTSRQRFQKIKERLMRREIRAGRRRLRERRPGCVGSGGSSVSESVTRFLQDPMASELQLQPASVAECDQLQRLAQLYSLHLRVADSTAQQQHEAAQHTAEQPSSCVVTKTSGTTPCSSASSFPWGLPTPLSDASKKRRKTPTPPLYTSFAATDTTATISDVTAVTGERGAGATASAAVCQVTSANGLPFEDLEPSYCEEMEMVG